MARLNFRTCPFGMKLSMAVFIVIICFQALMIFLNTGKPTDKRLHSMYAPYTPHSTPAESPENELSATAEDGIEIIEDEPSATEHREIPHIKHTHKKVIIPVPLNPPVNTSFPGAEPVDEKKPLPPAENQKLVLQKNLRADKVNKPIHLTTKPPAVGNTRLKAISGEDPRVLDIKNLMERNQLSPALKDIDILLKEDPESYLLLFLRGEILYRLGRFNEARLYYGRAESKMPQAVNPLIRQAEIAQITDQPQKAHQYLTMLEKKEDFNDFNRIFRVDIYLMESAGKKIQNLDEWEKFAQRAMVCMKAIENLDLPETYVLKGNLAYLRGELDTAINLYREAVSRPDLNSAHKRDILLGMAKIQMERRKPSESIPFLNAVIKSSLIEKPDYFDKYVVSSEYATALKKMVDGSPPPDGYFNKRKAFYEGMKKSGFDIIGYDPTGELAGLEQVMAPVTRKNYRSRIRLIEEYIEKYSDGKKLPQYFTEKMFLTPIRKMVGYYYLAEAYRIGGDPGNARKYYGTALQHSSGNAILIKKLNY